MARGFDIERRKRVPAQSQSKHSKRSSGSIVWFVLLLLLSVGGLYFYNFIRTKNIRPMVQTLPPSTISSAPAAQSAPRPTASLPTAEPTPTATSPSPDATPEATATLTPTPPTPTSDKITLRLLNGSGTAGAATLLRAQLVRAGFIVRSVALAKTRRQTTIIYYATGKRTEAELVGKSTARKNITYEESPTIVDSDTLVVIVGAR